MFGGAHDNSRLQHDFGEEAPGCFSSNSVSVNSAIHLHCSCEQFFFHSVFIFCTFKKKKTSLE